MNKYWSELNKVARALLNKKSTFDKGICKLIALRTTLFDAWVQSAESLSNDDYSKQPLANSKGYDSKTIAYSIYHVFRIEDIVLNTLINNSQQVFLRDSYQTKLSSPISTTGNELKGGDIVDFSKQLNIQELWNYARSVLDQSNSWLQSLTHDKLKKTFSHLDQERIKSTDTVAESESWLIEYWCKKDIKGLLAMPFSRHWIMHLEASLRIQNKLTK